MSPGKRQKEGTVYCPKCGHDNQPDIKFCTRCGTNLGVVSDALAGIPVGAPDIDDRMVDLLTRYHNGRRSAAVGGVSLSIGVLMVILLLAAGLNQDNIPLPGLLLVLLAACGLVYGAIAVILGVSEWIQSGSAMTALGYSAPAKIAQAHRLHLSSPSVEELNRSQGEYATDPIRYSASVTEQTTNLLDEHSSSSPPKESNRPDLPANAKAN